jgi:hypothetical protein
LVTQHQVNHQSMCIYRERLCWYDSIINRCISYDESDPLFTHEHQVNHQSIELLKKTLRFTVNARIFHMIQNFICLLNVVVESLGGSRLSSAASLLVSLINIQSLVFSEGEMYNCKRETTFNHQLVY